MLRHIFILTVFCLGCATFGPKGASLEVLRQAVEDSPQDLNVRTQYAEALLDRDGPKKAKRSNAREVIQLLAHGGASPSSDPTSPLEPNLVHARYLLVRAYDVIGDHGQIRRTIANTFSTAEDVPDHLKDKLGRILQRNAQRLLEMELAPTSGTPHDRSRTRGGTASEKLNRSNSSRPISSHPLSGGLTSRKRKKFRPFRPLGTAAEADRFLKLAATLDLLQRDIRAWSSIFLPRIQGLFEKGYDRNVIELGSKLIAEKTTIDDLDFLVGTAAAARPLLARSAPERAQTALERYIDKASSKGEKAARHFRIARAVLKRYGTDLALSHLDAGLDIDPKNDEALQLRIRVLLQKRGQPRIATTLADYLSSKKDHTKRLKALETIFPVLISHKQNPLAIQAAFKEADQATGETKPYAHRLRALQLAASAIQTDADKGRLHTLTKLLAAQTESPKDLVDLSNLLRRADLLNEAHLLLADSCSSGPTYVAVACLKLALTRNRKDEIETYLQVLKKPSQDVEELAPAIQFLRNAGYAKRANALADHVLQRPNLPTSLVASELRYWGSKSKSEKEKRIAQLLRRTEQQYPDGKQCLVIAKALVDIKMTTKAIEWYRLASSRLVGAAKALALVRAVELAKAKNDLTNAQLVVDTHEIMRNAGKDVTVLRAVVAFTQKIASLKRIRAEAMERLAGLGEGDETTELALAEIWMNLGDYDRASASLLRLLSTTVNPGEAYQTALGLFRRQYPVRVLSRVYANAPDLIREDPRYVTATAEILHRRGSREQAAQLYRKALDLSLGQPATLKKLAQKLRSRGFPSLALHAFQLAYKGQGPGPHDLIITQAAIKAGNLSMARKYAQRYIRSSKRESMALQKVGNIFLNFLRYEDAYSYLNEALEKHKGRNPTRLLVRLIDLAKKLRKRDALTKLAGKLVPDPRSSRVRERNLTLLADAFRTVGRPDQAFKYQTAIARRRPNDGKRWLKVAELHFELGRPKEAKETLLLAFERTSLKSRKVLLEQMRQLLLEAEREQILVDVAVEIRNEHPGVVELSILEAEGLFRLGRLDEGHQTFIRAIHEADEPGDYWKRIHLTYRHLAPIPLNLAFLQESMALLPQESEISEALGDLYLIAGNKHRAIQAYERFLGQTPSRAGHVANRLRDAGLLHDALRFFRVAAGHQDRDDTDKILESYVSLARRLQGDDGARNAVAYVLREKGQKAWVLNQCASALIDAGLLQDAGRLLELLAEQQEDGAAHKLLGILGYIRREPALMERHFRLFVDHAADSVGSRKHSLRDSTSKSVDRRLEIARFFADEGKFEPALKWAIETQSLPGGRVTGLLDEAYIALRAGKIGQSLSAFEQALRIDPMTALIEGRVLTDLAVHTGNSCSFLPLIQKTKIDGPIRPITLFRLAAACGDDEQVQEASTDIQALALVGAQELPILAGSMALESGLYDQAVEFYRTHLEHWRNETINKDNKESGGALAGLVRALGMRAQQSPKEKKHFEKTIRTEVNEIWQGSGSPVSALNILSEMLGPRLNQWKLARELTEKLIALDPAESSFWLRRITIALEYPHDDPLMDVVRRAKNARAPTKRIYDMIRSVWVEIGRTHDLPRLRKEMGLPETVTNVGTAWARFEDYLHALDLKRARLALDSVVQRSDRALLWYHKIVRTLLAAGWHEEAAIRIKEARGLFPDDRTLRWLDFRLALTNSENRQDTVKALTEWLLSVHIAPLDSDVLPTVEDIADHMTGSELVALAQEFTKREIADPELELLRAIAAARTKNWVTTQKAIERFDKTGMDVPRSLLILARESALGGSTETTLKAANGVLRWAGFVSGSQHLIRVLDNLLTTKKLEPATREAIGEIGVQIVENYLRVAIPGISTTTNMATFQTAAGRPIDAIYQYQSLSDKLPGLASARNNLAYHLAVTNLQSEEGLKLVSEALALEPAGAAFYLDTRGWLHYRRGDYKKAAKDIDASLRLGPLHRSFTSEESQIHAAEVALKRGQNQKARRHALRARLLAPTGPISERALEILGNTFQ